MHAKAWTAVIVVSLALGIGANTAIFSALNGTPNNRLATNRLAPTAPNDVASIAVATTVMIGVAAAAVYLPARRAWHVDPMVALRYE